MDFFYLLVSAIVLSFIPVLRLPFNLFEVYLHELSHALMSKIGFCKVDRITLQLNGSGSCHSYRKNGFHSFSITLFGYLGASIFGLLIFTLGKQGTQFITHENITITLSLFTLTIILWVRDFMTFFLHLVIMILFIIPLFIDINQYSILFIQFTGIYIILQSIIAPLHLIDGLDDGDGGDLEKMTYIPEGVWITLWILFALYCLYSAYLIS